MVEGDGDDAGGGGGAQHERLVAPAQAEDRRGPVGRGGGDEAAVGAEGRVVDRAAVPDEHLLVDGGAPNRVAERLHNGGARGAAARPGGEGRLHGEQARAGQQALGALLRRLGREPPGAVLARLLLRADQRPLLLPHLPEEHEGEAAEQRDGDGEHGDEPPRRPLWPSARAQAERNALSSAERSARPSHHDVSSASAAPPTT